MTLLNLIYCLLGAVFIVLGGVCLWEKYRTVHGGMRLPARIIRCQRQGPKNRRQSGGYCFVVEFTTPDGIRHTAATNDSFWFDQTRRVGTVIEVWYNPASPTVVERRSLEAELLGALFIALGFAVIFWLGLTLGNGRARKRRKFYKKTVPKTTLLPAAGRPLDCKARAFCGILQGNKPRGNLL